MLRLVEPPALLYAETCVVRARAEGQYMSVRQLRRRYSGLLLWERSQNFSTTMSNVPPAPSAPVDKIYKWSSKSGEFKRQESTFRHCITPDGEFQPEKGRYHLYVSLACPWAHRTLIVRALKGLQDVISVSVVDWLLGPEGWKFSSNVRGATNDSVNGAALLKEIYLKANPDYNLRFTVPVLWDTKHETIVNNESSEIIRILDEAFDALATNPSASFYPVSLRKEIDALNEWIYPAINNGVYRAGFATAQEPYNEAVGQVFDGLDRVEAILSKSPFLIGSIFTEADIRLFTTIYRFDPVYHTHFKCTNKTITHDYPHILRWLRQVYRMAGVKETCDMEHIKKHYYVSHKQINPFGIVPTWDGPDLDTN